MEAAFFDLDKTVIARSSVLAFGRPFYQEGMLSRTTIVKGLYAQIIYMFMGADEQKMERMRHAMLALTKGWDQQRVRTIVRSTLDETVSPLIYSEALTLFEEHRRAGRKVFIVSSSPIEIVEPMAEFLGVDEAIGTRGKLDEHGRYTGELDLYVYGEHKATELARVAARDGIDLSRSYAYSDSVTDLPMLSAVGNPYVVNPDRELERAARDNGWPQLDFQKPVRLRDRLPDHPAAAPQAIGSGVLLAGAAAVTVWWWSRRRPRPA